MPEIKKYSMGILLFAILLAVFVYAKIGFAPKDQSVSFSEKINLIEGKIRFLNGANEKEYSFQAEEGDTVFELMKNMADEKKISMGYQESQAGVFVNSINNVKNDSADNMFWMLYVNDKLAPVGASGYKLLSGDVVEWRYLDTSKMNFSQ